MNYPTSLTLQFNGLVVGQLYHWVPGIHEVSFTCGSATFTQASYFAATADTATVTGTAAGAQYTGALTNNTQSAFVPEKFVILNGRVYCRGTDRRLYLYGGADNNTYDNTVVTVVLPYLDDESPALYKQASGVNLAIAGKWTVSVSMDPISGTYSDILTEGSATAPASKQDSSFDTGKIPYSERGTHFSLKAVSSNTSFARAVLSSLIFSYDKADNP
jgi:hypothetical protein